MPWDKSSKHIEGLPDEAKSLWVRVANQELAKSKDEGKAIAYAWTAVENAGYKKKGGKWIKEAITMDVNNLKAKLLKLKDLKESKRHHLLIDEAESLIEHGGSAEEIHKKISQIDKAIVHCKSISKDEDVKESAEEFTIDSEIGISLKEAVFDEEKKQATITIIKAGFNWNKSRYYPEKTLKESVGMLVGTKMYKDHLTEAEEKALGGQPRKTDDWVGTIIEAHWDNALKEISGKVQIVKDTWWTFLKGLKESKRLSDIGTSINAFGSAVSGKIGDIATRIIEGIKKYKSVDFVTEAGAGGSVSLLENQQEKELDYEKITFENLVEKRPDLIKQIKEATKEEYKKIGDKYFKVSDLIKESKDKKEDYIKVGNNYVKII